MQNWPDGLVKESEQYTETVWAYQGHGCDGKNQQQQNSLRVFGTEKGFLPVDQDWNILVVYRTP